MNDLTRISATFAVGAGAVGSCEIDITGLTPDEIAELVKESSDVDTTLCWQCSDHVIDPEVSEMTSFTVDNVDYARDGDHWVVSS